MVDGLLFNRQFNIAVFRALCIYEASQTLGGSHSLRTRFPTAGTQDMRASLSYTSWAHTARGFGDHRAFEMAAIVGA